MYLTAFATGLAAFVYCSFWVYHYVEIEYEALEREENGGLSAHVGVQIGHSP